MRMRLSGLLPLLCALLFAGAARADVIVLKSGRRISATNVVEEGERVYYETRSGRLSFPKSAVERIERGAFTESASGAVAAAVTAPRSNPAEGFDDVVRATLRAGSIDRNYLAQLESEAQPGDSLAAQKVAVAHHVAAQSEVRRGDLPRALDHYRRALTFAPEHLGLLLHAAHLHLTRSEFTAALDYLERARRAAPDDADTAKLLGWAYRGMNRMDRAVEEWRRALRLRPDGDVEAALEQARRDEEEEKSYREGGSLHFNLLYNGVAAPGLAREVLRSLEQHFRAIESELNYTPPDSIAVILYTEQAFADITRSPGWVGAINDGRIRVPVEGLTSVGPELSRILKHELTHSFIRQKTRERCPTWLNEGLAQWMEGKRSDEHGAEMAAIFEKVGPVSPKRLEGSFLALSEGGAVYAYALSLGIVEYMVRTHGMGDVQRLLDRIASEPSTEAALRSVYRFDYIELQQEANRYLKKTYVR